MILCASATQPTHNMDKAAWLIGTWENKTSRGSVFETWRKANDQELTGMSYILNQQDTVVFETIRITSENGKLWYVPTVKNQNEGEPIKFEQTAVTDHMMRFENPAHDFPQTIKYERISPDSLVAEISGTVNGQYRSQVFPMKRKHK